ncbi:MAG: HAD family hydrolase [Pseudomonadota bacterium]
MSFFDKYKAIFFDWDGTLVDSCDLILDAHNVVRKHFDKPLWTMDDFLGRASESAREYYPKVYGDDSDTAQKILYDFVEKHHLNYLEVMDSAFDLVRDLDVSCVVVSNKRHQILEKEIDHLQVANLLDCIVGAGVAKKDKPSSDPLLLGMKEVNPDLTPNNILYVGDTETDLLCAKNTGCDVVLIQSNKARPDLIEKYQPILSFMTIKEFYSFYKEQKPVKSSQIA